MSTFGAVSIAGCSGGDGDGPGTATTTGGTVTTEPGADLPDPGDPSYAAEWRKVAAREAERELSGPNSVVLASPPGRAGDETFHAITAEQDFASIADVYAPLTDNVEIVSATSADHIARYRRELAVGNETSSTDVLVMEISSLIQAGVLVGDLSSIPGYIANGDYVKDHPHQIGFAMQAQGLVYNPEVAPEPNNYEELLTDKFRPGQIVTDFTPGYLSVTGIFDKMGEDYVRQLGDRGIALITSSFGAVDRVGKGEFGVSFLGLLHLGLRIAGRGAPVEFTSNPDVWIWMPNLIGMSGIPPHPWAAKLFVDYITRPDHGDIQAFAEGTLSLNGEVANPTWVPDLFRPENAYSPADTDRSPEALDARFAELLGAPIGGEG